MLFAKSQQSNPMQPGAKSSGQPGVGRNPVERLYLQYLAEGYTKKEAATIAQKKTGLALVTGKPIKRGQYKYGKETRSGQTQLT